MPQPTKPTTNPPSRSALQLAGAAIARVPPWGIVIVATVLILAWAYLAVHGKAPVP
jgi:hypothetical protein